MLKSIIVAKSVDGGIGLNGGIPWHLPEDLRYFRDRTMHHHVLFGRKTYESLPSLPGRKLIVLTHDKYYSCPETVVNSLDDAISIAHSDNDDELFIAGGSTLYSLCLSLVDKMYITDVHGKFNADSFFPIIHHDEWDLTQRSGVKVSQNSIPYEFLVYRRIA